MKKEHIIKAIIGIINDTAETYGLEVMDNGTGKAFEKSVWEGLLSDDSNIPNVIAKGEGYRMELRSFWGCPELDIHRMNGLQEEYLMVNYSEGEKFYKEPDDEITQDDIDNLIRDGVLKLVIDESIKNKDGEEKKEYTKEVFYKDKSIFKSTNEYSYLTMYECTCIKFPLNDTKMFPEKETISRELKDIMVKKGYIKRVETGDYKVYEVRCNSRVDYKQCMKDIYDIIDDIETRAKELEQQDMKKKKSKGEAR